MFKLFKKIQGALSKTRSFLSKKIEALFQTPWDEETLDKFEQALYEADLGTKIASDFTDLLRRFLKKHPQAKTEEILDFLKGTSVEVLSQPPLSLPKNGHPTVFLIVGVNGSGKTTSIAKLAAHFQSEGKSVLLAAADTFRAAAIDQLTLWAKRLQLDIVKGSPGGDPSAVAFDALTAAKARGVDIVLIDTAGRLHNKTELMQELEKIKRVCHKVVPEAPHETLLILDATIGQNGLEQALTFHQFTPLTGIILSKLDGSAKGGMLLSIYDQLRVPIRWIGVGESAEDLSPFDPNTYAEGLFGHE